jgi:hypothetical protein
MGIARNIPIKTVMDSCSTAISQIGMMLLIIGGGGAFKQVLINGGVGDYVADLFKETALSPILLAWLIAAILRISLGSATVAALSTTGLQPCISGARNWRGKRHRFTRQRCRLLDVQRIFWIKHERNIFHMDLTGNNYLRCWTRIYFIVKFSCMKLLKEM